MSGKKRIVFLDYVRAFCMLWIVGFWHFSEYCTYSLSDKLWASNVTVGVLGTFVFISAYLLGNRRFITKSDIQEFYKKRLLRVYPLFFVSCASFYVLHLLRENINYISTLKQLILTLLGVSCFFIPAPYTIWFISMLIFLYFITPFINMVNNVKLKGCILLLISFLVISIKIIDINIDNRLLYLIPIYCLGLFLSQKRIFEKEKRGIYSVLMITGLICFYILTFTKLNELNYIYRNLAVSASLATSILCFFKITESIISKATLVRKLLVAISYSSFCIYLFHRQVFGAIVLFINPFPIWFGYAIVLPGTIVLMYYMQKLYDKIISIVRAEKSA